MDHGDALVVLYGKNLEKAHIDIIGSSISMAAKVASLAQPNQVLIGESIYNILESSISRKDFVNNNKFIEVNLDPTKWSYPSHLNTGSIYCVYEYSYIVI